MVNPEEMGEIALGLKSEVLLLIANTDQPSGSENSWEIAAILGNLLKCKVSAIGRKCIP